MSSVSPNLDISVDPMDNEAMTCLEKLRNGHPLPPDVNVIKDANLSEFNGTYLPDLSRMWLYYTSENPREKSTCSGYWVPTDNQRIVVLHIVGWKTTLRFQPDQAPGEQRTSCMMHEYKMDRMDPQGSNFLQGSSSLCQIFWENPEPPLGERSGVEEKHRDFVHESLTRIVYNTEGNHHNVQDSSSSHPVVNGGESLPGKEWAEYFFGVPDDIRVPDDILNHQDLLDAIREEDFLELNDLTGPEPSHHLGSENSTNAPPVVNEENLPAVLEQMLGPDSESESSETQSTARKCSIVTGSNSELVVIKAPVSGTTKEIAIPAAKLEKLLERLIKIGSKRATETNQGSRGTARGGISFGGIVKMWKKLRSRPTVGVIS